MPIKAVFFDLFETLVTEFADGRRISKRNYDYAELLGIPNEDFKQSWNERSRQRMTGAFPDYACVLRDILASRALVCDEERIESLYQARLIEKALPFHAIHSDVIALLKTLKSNNIKIGLISNCTEEEVRGLPGSELAAYLDDVIYSFEVGAAKPDADIYVRACQRLFVKPEESVFVGDGGSSELDGAREAGMRAYHAVWFNTYLTSSCKRIASPMELCSEVLAGRETAAEHNM